jgi:hypothetical protein
VVTFVESPPKMNLPVLSWNDVEHLERVRDKARHLQASMVGSLYPSILQNDIDTVTERIRELRGSQS